MYETNLFTVNFDGLSNVITELFSDYPERLNDNTMEIELPGIVKDSIDINISNVGTNTTLCIKAKTKKGKDIIRNYTIRNIKKEVEKAKYEDGILTIIFKNNSETKIKIPVE